MFEQLLVTVREPFSPKIVNASKVNLHNQNMNVVHRFWNFQPSDKMSVQLYVKEFDRRFQDLSEHSFVIPEIEAQMRLLLLFHINQMQPELASRYREFSFQDTISECLQWNSSGSLKPTPAKNCNTCKFCKNLGHNEEDCRKKKKAEKHKSQRADSHSNKNVLSLHNPQDNSGYQLDTAADFHVSGNELDFSSYTSSPQIVRVAGGSQVTATGRGNLMFPSIEGNTELLSGAIHIPGQTNRIISTAQLEKQGFSIRWPSKYQNVELLRPDGSVCAVFRRISGRLIFIPLNPSENYLVLIQ